MGSSVSFHPVLLLQAAFLVSAARKLSGLSLLNVRLLQILFASLVSSKPTSAQFSVAKWWKGTEKYYQAIGSEKSPPLVLSLGAQFLDEGYSLSKSLSSKQIVQLALKDRQRNSVNAILTASDVAVEGQCAWPFRQPIYGPQSPPLVAPNNDVGLDGLIINLASLLAGTATNPFGNGYFQGPKEAPLEAASACPGVYGKGSYPGYAGDVLVDSATRCQ
ncbi:hypothetical protein OIU78_012187 [Salix suchowensis]|nr:hypothetical protein OIU78_012187 [Salix suchowensis]